MAQGVFSAFYVMMLEFSLLRTFLMLAKSSITMKPKVADAATIGPLFRCSNTGVNQKSNPIRRAHARNQELNALSED
jgi:hypothetical protein